MNSYLLMRKLDRKTITGENFCLRPEANTTEGGGARVHEVPPNLSRASSAFELSAAHEVTRLLAEWASGNSQVVDDLIPLVYRELRQLAARCLRKERQGHTLQPTALVHEAFLRLVDQKCPNWQTRSHFFGVAAHLMRQILVDHARRRQAGKRAAPKVSLEEALSFHRERGGDLIALDLGLNALEKVDPRKSRAIELRYFGGLSMDEIAQTLDISPVTVRRDLRMAEAWLHREMKCA